MTEFITADALSALLQVVLIDLVLAGGVLLLWVCWKMWRELREQAAHAELAFGHGGGGSAAPAPRKSFGQAAVQIVAADVSMSLDNVLAVAGAAREQPIVLVFGLALSIAMMGAAATFIARLLQNHLWIAYLGLAVILYVAVDMTIRGANEIAKVAPA